MRGRRHHPDQICHIPLTEATAPTGGFVPGPRVLPIGGLFFQLKGFLVNYID
jgi:hypothetical protein